jgi:sugar lactone lactonase YvrE
MSPQAWTPPAARPASEASAGSMSRLQVITARTRIIEIPQPIRRCRVSPRRHPARLLIGVGGSFLWRVTAEARRWRFGTAAHRTQLPNTGASRQLTRPNDGSRVF